MKEFANYGFNKSHAAAYAYLAYQCAFLKAYYPAEFMASVLSSEIGNPKKLLEYYLCLKDLNIEILKPDVNYSDAIFSVEQNKIRYALTGIKGVGDTAASNMVNARVKEGKFKDLYHFLQSIDLRVNNRAVLEILIKSGCIDSFGQKRKWCFEHLDEAINEAQIIQTDKKIGQKNLFDEIEKSIADDVKPGVDVEEWSIKELLEMEKEILGFYISGHPLENYKGFIKDNCSYNSKTLRKINLNSNYSHKVPVVIAGIINKIKIFKDNDENDWAILTVEDFYGQFEVRVFKNEYNKFKSLLIEKKPIIINGYCFENKNGDKSVTASLIEDFEKRQYSSLSEFHIYLKDLKIEQDLLKSFKEALSFMNGELSVFFHVNDHGKDTVIKAQDVKASKDEKAYKNILNKFSFIDKIKIV